MIYASYNIVTTLDPFGCSRDRILHVDWRYFYTVKNSYASTIFFWPFLSNLLEEFQMIYACNILGEKKATKREEMMIRLIKRQTSIHFFPTGFFKQSEGD